MLHLWIHPFRPLTEDSEQVEHMWKRKFSAGAFVSYSKSKWAIINEWWNDHLVTVLFFFVRKMPHELYVKHLIKCFRLATIFWSRNSSIYFVSRNHFLVHSAHSSSPCFPLCAVLYGLVDISVRHNLPIAILSMYIHWHDYGESCTFSVALLPFILGVELILVKMRAIYMVRSRSGNHPFDGSGKLHRYNAVR